MSHIERLAASVETAALPLSISLLLWLRGRALLLLVTHHVAVLIHHLTHLSHHLSLLFNFPLHPSLAALRHPPPPHHSPVIALHHPTPTHHPAAIALHHPAPAHHAALAASHHVALFGL